MRESKLCLSFKDAFELLRKESFNDFEPFTSHTNLYKSNKGKLYFRTSKDYNSPNTTFWYTIHPDYVIENEIDYIILIAGFEGIFIIPRSYFLEFRKEHKVRCVKGGRENFAILRRDGIYYRKEPNCPEDDITPFFKPL